MKPLARKNAASSVAPSDHHDHNQNGEAKDGQVEDEGFCVVVSFDLSRTALRAPGHIEYVAHSLVTTVSYFTVGLNF